jgi:hypothetical protein
MFILTQTANQDVKSESRVAMIAQYDYPHVLHSHGTFENVGSRAVVICVSTKVLLGEERQAKQLAM